MITIIKKHISGFDVIWYDNKQIIMGGCISEGKKIIVPPNKKKQKQQGKSKIIEKQTNSINLVIDQVKEKQKYNKTTSEKFLITYLVQKTLDNATKTQGPKYISNNIDGACKILRVVRLEDINQQRLQVYASILQFQIQQDEESNILILDEYCCGLTITDILRDHSSSPDFQERVLKHLIQIYDIINKFHSKRIWLGSLQLESFQEKSPFDRSVKLVEYNLNGNLQQSIGFAHKEGYEMDWQFYGYLLKYVSCKTTPIFLPHKMQYSSSQIGIISQLLKGKKIDREKISEIVFIPLFLPIYYGYTFRKDVNKLIKMRKKRKLHSLVYYDYNSQKSFQGKSIEEVLYRVQTEKIMKRIQGYIGNVGVDSQEPFMMYGTGAEKLKILKQVFMIQQSKKMDELREGLMNIR